MALKVVGAGLGRTGTTSLKLVLERLLGDSCYHMSEVGNHPEHAGRWAAAYDGRLPDWDEMFRGYGATVDWPAAPFWPELAEAYPDAVIVLSLRDADAWWKSASATIFQALAMQFASEPDNDWGQMFGGMMRRFTPDWQDESAAKAAFEAYNDMVRQTAPADRLLEWQTSDGWAPLCERLGVAVPQEPFPHVNTTADMREMLGLDKTHP